MQDTFEKKSRETTPAYQPPDGTRLAEPYLSEGEGSEGMDSVEGGLEGDGLSDMEDDIV